MTKEHFPKPTQENLEEVRKARYDKGERGYITTLIHEANRDVKDQDTSKRFETAWQNAEAMKPYVDEAERFLHLEAIDADENIEEAARVLKQSGNTRMENLIRAGVQAAEAAEKGKPLTNNSPERLYLSYMQASNDVWQLEQAAGSFDYEAMIEQVFSLQDEKRAALKVEKDPAKQRQLRSEIRELTDLADMQSQRLEGTYHNYHYSNPDLYFIEANSTDRPNDFKQIENDLIEETRLNRLYAKYLPLALDKMSSGTAEHTPAQPELEHHSPSIDSLPNVTSGASERMRRVREKASDIRAYALPWGEYPVSLFKLYKKAWEDGEDSESHRQYEEAKEIQEATTYSVTDVEEFKKLLTALRVPSERATGLVNTASERLEEAPHAQIRIRFGRDEKGKIEPGMMGVFVDHRK